MRSSNDGHITPTTAATPPAKNRSNSNSNSATNANVRARANSSTRKKKAGGDNSDDEWSNW